MDRIIVEGGTRLQGSVRVGGAKNSVLPIMAAALLTDEELVVERVPRLRDVGSQCRLLESLGAQVEHDLDRGLIRMRVVNEDLVTAPYELVKTMRASICALGPLLAKRGFARVSLPGGCVIGVRPIDLHLKGLEALGAKIELREGNVVAEASRLVGTTLYMGGTFGSTVLGTANLLMAATLAEGESILECAAQEPEIVDLCHCLNSMGARIKGIGSHCLRVEGVERLGGATHTVIPDRIEAGTFLIAGAMCQGPVTVEDVEPNDLLALIERLRAAGCEVRVEDRSITVAGPDRLRALDVSTLPYPGFPTDLQAQMMSLLSCADGMSMVHERIYPDRFMHVAELMRMGAKIRKAGASAIIQGVPRLSGAPVMASDLRGSAGLVLAGLVADGETVIERVYHIDRGYEKIDDRLRALGARIRRVAS